MQKKKNKGIGLDLKKAFRFLASRKALGEKKKAKLVLKACTGRDGYPCPYKAWSYKRRCDQCELERKHARLLAVPGKRTISYETETAILFALQNQTLGDFYGEDKTLLRNGRPPLPDR